MRHAVCLPHAATAALVKLGHRSTRADFSPFLEIDTQNEMSEWAAGIYVDPLDDRCVSELV